MPSKIWDPAAMAPCWSCGGYTRFKNRDRDQGVILCAGCAPCTICGLTNTQRKTEPHCVFDPKGEHVLKDCIARPSVNGVL